jgi:hypothetical protein
LRSLQGSAPIEILGLHHSPYAPLQVIERGVGDANPVWLGIGDRSHPDPVATWHAMYVKTDIGVDEGMDRRIEDL